LAANVLTALWSLAIAVIAARRLDTTAFGRLALLLSAQVVVSTVMTSAIGQTAVRMTAELRGHDRERLRRVGAMLSAVSAGLSLFLSVLFLVGGSVAHAAVLGPDAPVDAIWGATVVLLCAGVSALQQGLLVGSGAFHAVAATNAVRLLVGVVVLVLGPPTLTGAVTAVAAGAGAGLGSGEWLWRRKHRGPAARVPWRDWSRELPVLWSFGVPSSLTGALFVSSAWLGNILTAGKPGGLAELGLFNAASQWGRSLLLFVPNAAAAPLLVTMAGQWGRRDLAGLVRVTRRGVIVCLAATLGACAIVYLLGHLLLGWYGPTYARALPVLHILLLSTSVASVTVVTNATLTASGRIWTVAAITALWAAVFLGTLAVEPARGAVGLATAYLVAYVVQVAVTIPPLVRALRPTA
jgi:O-antigen/teichoic acid export membrane protein